LRAEFQHQDHEAGRGEQPMDALMWALSALFYPTEEGEEVVVYDHPVTISPY
jgi:hypothetical protein